MDNPPVNALTVAGWFVLADVIAALGRNPAVRVVVLRAEGRGFNAGVDIKEMQATEGHTALIGANKGCFAAFAAVYDCLVPVIAAVNGFCLGGGVGLVGNADIIVAADDAYLPGCRRSARRRARRRDPPGPAGAAAQDAGHGLHVGHRDGGRAAPLRIGAGGRARTPRLWSKKASPSLELAGQIAAKSPTVIRAAKESLNGIDLWDVKRSYRYEQGFTFELNLSGVADEHRDAFVAKRDTDVSQLTSRSSSRPMTEQELQCRQAHQRGRRGRRDAVGRA